MVCILFLVFGHMDVFIMIYMITDSLDKYLHIYKCHFRFYPLDLVIFNLEKYIKITGALSKYTCLNNYCIRISEAGAGKANL